MSRAYYGKYRGRVVNIDDKDKLGRLRAKVPSLFGDEELDWALPCLPMAAEQAGVLFVPPVGSSVWIEFEQGDPSFPIWTGCLWSKDDSGPDDKRLVPGKSLAFATPGGHSIVLKDGDGGGIVLTSKGGVQLEITDKGITLKKDGVQIKLDDGITLDTGGMAKIKLDSSKVTVNDGALEVT
jgi:uncharacterized protein involved in type VI secretion and phage assembly